ncbi:MAG: MFS transporter [Coriobacteriia bacterium]
MTPRNNSWLKTFLIIFTGQAFSLLGSAAVNFALVWWITAETGSATILAYAAIAAILPQALLGPIAGPLVDRWDRRITMVVADLLIAATSVALIVLFAAGQPTTGIIIAALALRAVGAAFHTPASQAAVPMYVPADELMRVSGWNFFMSSGVAMAGPVLGAFLMSVAPITAVIVVDVAGALIAVTSLMLVRIPHPKRLESDAPSAGFLGEFMEGWRELKASRGLFDLTIVLTIVTVLYMPLNALFPLMTFAHFSGGAREAAIVEFAFGAGMLVGSLAIGALTARFPAVRLLQTGIVLIGALLALSGLLPGSAFWAFAVLCVAMGVSVPLFGAPITAMFQLLIEPSRLGRVMSLYMTITMLVSPIGLLFAGPLAERSGVAVWFALSGALIAVTGLAVSALPAVRSLDAAVRARTSADSEAQPSAAEKCPQAE